MFKHFLVIGALVFGLLATQNSFAVSNSGYQSRVKLASTNLTTGTWVAMVNTTAKAIKGIFIASTAADSGGQIGDIQVGIAAASATANTEVSQLIIPAQSATTGVYIPLVLSGSTRISVEAVDTTLSKGEVILDLLSN